MNFVSFNQKNAAKHLSSPPFFSLMHRQSSGTREKYLLWLLLSLTCTFFPGGLAAKGSLSAQSLDHVPSFKATAQGRDKPIWVDLIQAGSEADRGGRNAIAALAYYAASWLSHDYGDFFRLKALEVALEADPAEISKLPFAKAWLAEDDMWKTSYPTTPVVKAKFEAKQLKGPQAATVRSALRGQRNAEMCSWLRRYLSEAGAEEAANGPKRDALYQLEHAYCVDRRLVSSLAERERMALPDWVRLERADRLYGFVHFNAARRELSDVNFEALDIGLWCRATYREAATQYRLLTQRYLSDGTYAKVVERCGPQKDTDPIYRIRSLYALGKRAHARGDYVESSSYFTQLLQDYPQVSHADDALFYLARNARAQGKTQDAAVVMHRALRDYAQGDMVHELVWEQLEDLVEGGKSRAYLDALKQIELPDHDDQYYSQGRLEYFSGRAHAELGNTEQAKRIWTALWQKYPFSFYGYLAFARARESGVDLASLELEVGSPQADLNWLRETTEHYVDLIHLAAAGHADWAVEVLVTKSSSGGSGSTEKSTSPARLWTEAYLNHHLGNFALSHNIARRQIGGVPWTDPIAGRRIRWSIGWPTPFLQQVAQSTKAEQKQHSATMHHALPLAIMREESSFIPDIESYAGALGLMQLMPSTALGHDDDVDGRATPERLTQPEVNIRVGVDHLFSLSRRWNEHPALMAVAYNAGSGRVRSWLRRFKPISDSAMTSDLAWWIEGLPYQQARDYSKRVMGSYAAYQWLVGQKNLDRNIAHPPKH